MIFMSLEIKVRGAGITQHLNCNPLLNVNFVEELYCGNI